MNKLVSIFVLSVLLSCSSNAQQKDTSSKKYKINKTESEWRNSLTSEEFYVLREAGTERAFMHPFNKNKSEGVYVCAACKTPLYLSEHKYDSGSGWPSFDRAVKENVELDVDYKIGYARTELKCNTCGGHLGHFFEDGPKETTGVRHCINGAALKFVAKKSKK